MGTGEVELTHTHKKKYWKLRIIRLFFGLCTSAGSNLSNYVFCKGDGVTFCCFGIQGVVPAVTAVGELTVSITRGKEANKY